MYIPVILLLVIVVIAVSPNETRKVIAKTIQMLVGIFFILAIILAVIAAIWFFVDWLWTEFPSKKAHNLITFFLGVCGVTFIAGLFGYEFMD